ncbi:MAG: OmpA family protein [Bacteroidales bacterium]|nr:OmpA family protein [Bacteroidales bacterium]
MDLLRQDDRRVSVESTYPEILMEFMAGSDVPLKPVSIYDIQEAPFESYVSFTVEDAPELLESWSLEITDVNGLTQYFGPYTDSKIFIPGKDMLGTTPKGDYTIKMIGKTKNGKTVIKDDEAHLVLWTPSPDDEMMRFSIIYGFDSFNAIKMYEQYLTKIIIPKIPNGATVIISGYADITGDSNYNEKLSRDRANDVKSILNAGLIKAGKTNVVFNVTGYGEKLDYAPFENKLPEERFYNRTVIIDVVQKK